MDTGNATADEFAHRAHAMQRFSEAGTTIGYRRNLHRIRDVAGNPHLLVHCEERLRGAANPTQSAYGTPGAGSPMHFLGAMLADAAGFKYLHVPYQGSGPATQDVLSGQIASAIVPVPAVVQLSEPGRLRVLATTGPERSTSVPDVPTMKEAGFPALEFSEWFGILLPTKTDMEIATSLNGVVRNAMKTDEFKSGLVKLSLEPAGSSMSDFAQRMRADTARWAPIIKASGFAAD
jgi:tripartite-type tricarboxylate transporter receptor subunit TctC